MSNQHSGCGAESLIAHTASSQVSEVCSLCYDFNEYESLLNAEQQEISVLNEELRLIADRRKELECELKQLNERRQHLMVEVDKKNVAENLVYKAVSTNNIDMLKWLYTKELLNDGYDFFKKDCIANDSLECLEFIRQNIQPCNNVWVDDIEVAIEHHSNRCLKYLIPYFNFKSWTCSERISVQDRGYPDEDTDDVWENRYNEFTRLAVTFGNAEALRLLFDNGCTIMDEELLNISAERGDLNCLKMAFEEGHRFEDYGIDSTFGLKALHGAVSGDHIECLTYLIEVAECGTKTDNKTIVPFGLIDKCISSKAWNCLRYLVEGRKREIKPLRGVFSTSKTARLLLNSTHSNLEIVKYMHANDVIFSVHDLVEAVQSGFIDALEYLLVEKVVAKINLYETIENLSMSYSAHPIYSAGFIRCFNFIAQKVYGPWDKQTIIYLLNGISLNETLLDDAFCRWLAFNPERLPEIRLLSAKVIETIKNKEKEVQTLYSSSELLYNSNILPKDVVVYNLQGYF